MKKIILQLKSLKPYLFSDWMYFTLGIVIAFITPIFFTDKNPLFDTQKANRQPSSINTDSKLAQLGYKPEQNTFQLEVHFGNKLTKIHLFKNNQKFYKGYISSNFGDFYPIQVSTPDYNYLQKMAQLMVFTKDSHSKCPNAQINLKIGQPKYKKQARACLNEKGPQINALKKMAAMLALGAQKSKK